MIKDNSLNQNQCSDIKARMIAKLESILNERLQTANFALEQTRLSLQSDSKSSAGDKFETGREMMQQELDKHESARNGIISQIQSLEYLKSKRRHVTIEQGCLVNTEMFSFYLSFSFGNLEYEDRSFYVVSAMAPIGQLLLGKKVGSLFDFQGKSLKILSVC